MKKSLLFVTTCLVMTAIYAQHPAMGDNTSAADYAKVLKAADRATRDLTDIPSSFSLKKYAPTPMNQGRYGTCVAWSSGYAARTISYAIQKNMTNKDSINNKDNEDKKGNTNSNNNNNKHNNHIQALI